MFGRQKKDRGPPKLLADEEEAPAHPRVGAAAGLEETREREHQWDSTIPHKKTRLYNDTSYSLLYPLHNVKLQLITILFYVVQTQL